MSVPIFEVTRSQILDWCQTGRLAGGSDARVGQWLVMEYGCEFARPLRYVKVFSACDSCQDAVSTLDLFAALPVGVLGWEYEVWHVVYDDEVSTALEALRQLRAAGDDIVPPCDYVADHDGECTLIMHWVPSLGSHVAVLVNRFGVSLPTDWQCLQPRTLADCVECDWLSSDEFVQDFTSADYAQVIKAYEDSILCVR